MVGPRRYRRRRRPTGRSSRALIPPSSLLVFTGVSRPVYGDATHGSIHLRPAQRADHGVGREAFSFILSGSRSTWIRFSAPPIKSTLATPSTSSMEGTTSSSA